MNKVDSDFNRDMEQILHPIRKELEHIMQQAARKLSQRLSEEIKDAPLTEVDPWGRKLDLLGRVVDLEQEAQMKRKIAALTEENEQLRKIDATAKDDSRKRFLDSEELRKKIQTLRKSQIVWKRLPYDKPEKTGLYLVSLQDGSFDVCLYNKCAWWRFHYTIPAHVIKAWTEIPEVESGE